MIFYFFTIPVWVILVILLIIAALFDTIVKVFDIVLWIFVIVIGLVGAISLPSYVLDYKKGEIDGIDFLKNFIFSFILIIPLCFCVIGKWGSVIENKKAEEKAHNITTYEAPYIIDDTESEKLGIRSLPIVEQSDSIFFRSGAMDHNELETKYDFGHIKFYVGNNYKYLSLDAYEYVVENIEVYADEDLLSENLDYGDGYHHFYEINGCEYITIKFCGEAELENIYVYKPTYVFH